MARWAVGGIQGCDTELGELLARVGFRDERDTLWVVGDLVNRGPSSLQVLRRLYALRANVRAVLGNHDLHLLAVALAGARLRRGDTLAPLLAAPDRDRLIEWLLGLPLVHHDPARGDLLVHAGVAPSWSLAQTLAIADEVTRALRAEPAAVLAAIYGNDPDTWDERWQGAPRWRCAISYFTRLRFCTPGGRIAFDLKGPPTDSHAPFRPWFECAPRLRAEARIVFGHWSALGFLRAPDLLALDTGCVWGGELTAIDLDDPRAEPVSVPSRQPRSIEA